MAYELITRTSRSFYEVTSAMQNAIRKGDYEIAGYCMWELSKSYIPYLQKRLLVISAEDCYGIITKEILALSQIGSEEALTKALSLMCLAKKNRDADYFVCNIMSDSKTESNESAEKLGQELHRAIRMRDLKQAGQLSSLLFKKSRKQFWKMLEETAKAFYPHLCSEINALKIANETVTKPNEETIFVAKAIILMWTDKDDLRDLLAYPEISFDKPLTYDSVPIIKPISECKQIDGLFPEWAYNWHTYYGKYTLKRDAVHAIENDQKLLTPLEKNLFDECSWNVDINACLKMHNPRKRELPYDDGKVNPYELFSK